MTRRKKDNHRDDERMMRNAEKKFHKTVKAKAKRHEVKNLMRNIQNGDLEYDDYDFEGDERYDNGN